MEENRIYFNWKFSKRPGCWFTLIGTTIGLVALVMLAAAGSQMLQQQGYRSGQCTITAKQLRHELSTTTSTHNNGNTTYTTTTTADLYAPYFEYTVRTVDGHTYSASGYDGSDTFTSDRAGQQTIVDRYTIGQSYPCWYSPAKPTQAILFRQPNWVLILVGGGFLLVGALFATIGILSLIRPQGRSESGSQNDEPALEEPQEEEDLEADL